MSLVEHVEKLVKTECSEFFKESNDLEKKLWRGEKGTSLVSISNCPVDRKPRNTRPSFHKAADDWFLSRFGKRYRSNAVFGTGCKATAEFYASPARLIFPTNSYSVCWSPKVHDSYFFTFGRSLDEFVEFLDNAGYREGSLVEAIESGNEVMINCPFFLSIAETAITQFLRISH